MKLIPYPGPSRVEDFIEWARHRTVTWTISPESRVVTRLRNPRASMQDPDELWFDNQNDFSDSWYFCQGDRWFEVVEDAE